MQRDRSGCCLTTTFGIGAEGWQELEFHRDQVAQNAGPGFSIISRSPLPPHRWHFRSRFNGRITTISGARLAFSAKRSRFFSGKRSRNPMGPVRRLDRRVPAPAEACFMDLVEVAPARPSCRRRPELSFYARIWSGLHEVVYFSSPSQPFSRPASSFRLMSPNVGPALGRRE